MDIHENARLTPLGREHLAKMVLGGPTPSRVGAAWTLDDQHFHGRPTLRRHHRPLRDQRPDQR